MKWKFKARGPIVSTPAIQDGTLYFGCYDGGLYAVDIRTGSRKWRFSTQIVERRFQAKGLHGNKSKEQMIPDTWDFFTSSPVIYKNKVYYGSSDGNLYALNAVDGMLVWKYATNDIIHATAVVKDDVVYFGSWDSHFYAIGCRDGFRALAI